MDTLESLESKLRPGNWSDQFKDLPIWELQEPEIYLPKDLTDSTIRHKEKDVKVPAMAKNWYYESMEYFRVNSAVAHIKF
ncbi:hypothetical protein TNIN_395941 [Trichonephila inaurata madagascariensis]|uniref:Uncharacterized protein n=1 Tax=Trichonephila inaurata madagascariensis TaxID=2747483 RepID=A0A8X7C740_9ARAC|nr:hypothetical protein TNIN_395941 [Trichonephila inaurata madagascariensis]